MLSGSMDQGDGPLAETAAESETGSDSSDELSCSVENEEEEVGAG